MDDRTLTTKDVAAFLNLSPETVREQFNKGLLPGRKIGRDWRCLKSDLERYVRGTIEHDNGPTDHGIK